jgi:hypothetical protein
MDLGRLKLKAGEGGEVSSKNIWASSKNICGDAQE